MAATISAWVTTWSLVHAPCASSGMNSMKRTDHASLAPEAGEVDDLVVVHAPHHHAVDLDRVRARPSTAASIPASTRSSSSRLVSAWKRSARNESSDTLMRLQPGGRQVVGDVVERRAVGRQRRGRPAGAASFPTSTGRCDRTVGSPPVSRMLVDAEAVDEQAGEALDLLVGQEVASAGSHAIPSSGMQYVHRKLQRSVTEMRRSRCTRPNGVDQRSPAVSMVHARVGDARAALIGCRPGSVRPRLVRPVARRATVSGCSTGHRRPLDDPAALVRGSMAESTATARRAAVGRPRRCAPPPPPARATASHPGRIGGHHLAVALPVGDDQPRPRRRSAGWRRSRPFRGAGSGHLAPSATSGLTIFAAGRLVRAPGCRRWPTTGSSPTVWSGRSGSASTHRSRSAQQHDHDRHHRGDHGHPDEDPPLAARRHREREQQRRRAQRLQQRRPDPLPGGRLAAPRVSPTRGGLDLRRPVLGLPRVTIGQYRVGRSASRCINTTAGPRCSGEQQHRRR